MNFLLKFLVFNCESAGMFTPNDALAEELTEASKKGGEKFWRMPMEDGYWDKMKSNIADMSNSGGRPGGSITAALFLKQVRDFCNFLHYFLALTVPATLHLCQACCLSPNSKLCYSDLW